MNPSIKNLPWWTYVLPLLICHIGTQLSLSFQFSTGVALLYLPIPFAIAMIQWWGPRVLIGLYLNAVFSAGLWGLSNTFFWPLYALPETLAVALSWFLFTKLAHGRCWMPEIRDTLYFIVLAIIPAACIDGFLVPAQLFLLGDISSAGFWNSVWGEWIGTLSSGFAVAAPLVYLLTPILERSGFSNTSGARTPLILIPPDHHRSINKLEIAAILGCSLLLCLLVPKGNYWFLYAIIGLWAGLRYGIGLAMINNTWIVFLTLILPIILSKTYLSNFTTTPELISIHIGLGFICAVSIITGSTISTLSLEIFSRKKTETQLLFEKQFSDNLIEALPAIFYLYDQDMKLMKWNKNHETELNYSSEELKGKPIGEWYTKDDLKEAAIQEIQHILKTGNVGSLETGLLHKDNREIPYILTFARIFINGIPHFMGVGINITERKALEENIKKSLREKETLILELYHRTKNTMQVILSMLALQAAKFPFNDELQQLVKTTNQRIQIISVVHQMLYKSKDLSRISMKEYIENISSLIRQSYDITTESISLDLALENHLVLIDTAIPCGIILNELMNNSLKYAFPQQKKGIISISFMQIKPDLFQLTYRDNGVGVPTDFDFRNQKSLGLKLIFSIGEEQMQGTVKMISQNGVKCTIDFPAALYKERI